MRAKLQVSVCSGYDLFYPINKHTHTDRQIHRHHLTSLFDKLSQLSQNITSNSFRHFVIAIVFPILIITFSSSSIKIIITACEWGVVMRWIPSVCVSVCGCLSLFRGRRGQTHTRTHYHAAFVGGSKYCNCRW